MCNIDARHTGSRHLSETGWGRATYVRSYTIIGLLLSRLAKGKKGAHLLHETFSVSIHVYYSTVVPSRCTVATVCSTVHALLRNPASFSKSVLACVLVPDMLQSDMRIKSTFQRRPAFGTWFVSCFSISFSKYILACVLYLIYQNYLDCTKVGRLSPDLYRFEINLGCKSGNFPWFANPDLPKKKW